MIFDPVGGGGDIPNEGGGGDDDANKHKTIKHQRKNNSVNKNKEICSRRGDEMVPIIT